MLGDTAVAVHPDDERYRAPGRAHRAAADREPGDPGGRRRARRPDVRHRRGQGDPGARSQRLRDRPPARPAGADDPRRGCPDHRHRNAFRRHGPVRGAGRGQGGAARAGSDRRREDPVHPLGRALLAVRRRDRTAAVAPSGSSRWRRWPRPPATRSATAARRSTRRSWRPGTSTGSTTCTTGASPGSCGGVTGSRSGTDRTARSVASGRTRSRRATAGRRTRTCWTPGSPPGCGRSRPWAGRSRPTPCRAFYPTSVLVTGYDILFFWVVRMMMFGLYATRDADRRTAGAVSTPSRCTAWSATSTARRCPSPRATRVDPLQWIEDYGADAVRFTLARGVQPRRRPGDRRRLGRRLGQVLLEAVQRHQVRHAQRRQGARRRRSTPTR